MIKLTKKEKIGIGVFLLLVALSLGLFFGLKGHPKNCTPKCNGKTCGPDGCGGNCKPGCQTGYTCKNGACIKDGCTPQCSGKTCGPDTCGGTCPPGCETGYACDDNGKCVETGCAKSGEECMKDTDCCSTGLTCGSDLTCQECPAHTNGPHCQYSRDKTCSGHGDPNMQGACTCDSDYMSVEGNCNLKKTDKCFGLYETTYGSTGVCQCNQGVCGTLPPKAQVSNIGLGDLEGKYLTKDKCNDSWPRSCRWE